MSSCHSLWLPNSLLSGTHPSVYLEGPALTPVAAIRGKVQEVFSWECTSLTDIGLSDSLKKTNLTSLVNLSTTVFLRPGKPYSNLSLGAKPLTSEFIPLQKADLLNPWEISPLIKLCPADCNLMINLLLIASMCHFRRALSINYVIFFQEQ